MADNRDRTKENGVVHVHMDPELAQEMRRIIPYIPHEVIRTFVERAIKREIDRYYENVSEYHAGNTE